jgi:hypothetical protein
LSDSFRIQNRLKEGDALSPLLFNVALEYSIKKVQENEVRLILYGKHQLLACDDNLNLLGDSIDTINKTQKLGWSGSKRKENEVFVGVS